MLLIMAIAPVAVLLQYFLIKDRYEPEPRRLLWKVFVGGMLIVLPVIVVQSFLIDLVPLTGRGILPSFFSAFIVAGLVEEGFKYSVLGKFIWNNPNFNEPFDGIVYSVFASLGFATIENILYVLRGGVNVAIMRGILAVPAHALFAVAMGYYLSKAKFNINSRNASLKKALAVPVILHGLYNFLIFMNQGFLTVLFVPYVIYLWQRGLKNVNELAHENRRQEHDGDNLL